MKTILAPPHLQHTRVAILLTVLVAVPSLLLADSDQRLVVAPSLVVFATALIFAGLIWDRQGHLPLLDLGGLFMLAAVCYSLLPFLGYLLSGMRYTQLSAPQLRVHPPSPDMFAAVAWRYVVFIICFAVAHLAVRGVEPRRRPPLRLPPGHVLAGVVILWAGALAVFAVLWCYGIDLDPSYAADVKLARSRFVALPLFAQQIIQNLYEIRIGLQVALLVVLIRFWSRPWARVVLLGWILLMVCTRVHGLQARTDTAATLLALVVLYHTFVRRIPLGVLLAGGLAGLILFMAIPIVRNELDFVEGLRALGHWWTDADRASRFSRMNEFQNGFAGAYDLYRLKRTHLLPDVPWQLRAADITVLLPRQLLPFEKIHPQLWYRHEVADTRGFFILNPIGQAILGLDWIELILRGGLLGMFFGAVHRWYARQPDRFWTVWPYAWLAVYSYAAIRTPTFIHLYWIVYRIVPTALAVWLLAQCLRWFRPRPVHEPKSNPAEAPHRILHITSHASGGGAEAHMGYLAGRSARRGYDVHVAYLHPGPSGPAQPGPRLTFHRLGPRRNHDPRLLWDLLRLARRVRPDVIHTWTPQMDVLGGLVARLTAIPWILSEQTSVPAWPIAWKNVLRTRVAKRAHAIIANSSEGCDLWAKTCPAVPRYFVPNGIPLDRIERCGPADNAPDSDSLRNARRILYAGRLVPLKNVASLLDAVALLRRITPAHLVLCGDGPQRAELEGRARELNITEQVRFLGHVEPETVWAHMKRAAVFVNLSRFEGCPNAVQEAMACRCPLLLSDIPAHRELASPDAAIFVDGSSPPAIARALERILGDPDAARQRARAAYTMVLGFSIESMVEKYEDLYDGVVAGRVAPRRRPASNVLTR